MQLLTAFTYKFCYLIEDCMLCQIRANITLNIYCVILTLGFLSKVNFL